MASKFLRHPCSHVFYVSCIVLGFLGAAIAQQTGEKVVRANQAAQITDAVMISNVSVAGTAIECGLFIKPPAVVQPVTPFQAGSDWLQHMTIALLNRTNKIIVFGGIILRFMDTGDCHAVPCVGTELHFGQIPAVDAFDGITGKPYEPENPERPPIAWKPDQTIVIHVSDYMADIEKRLADSLSVTAVTKVNVYRGSFYFADGMKWALGRFSVPDPEHPGKFKELPADYFRGRRSDNWPPGYNR